MNGRARSHDPMIRVRLKAQVTFFVQGSWMDTDREAHVWSSFRTLTALEPFDWMANFPRLGPAVQSIVKKCFGASSSGASNCCLQQQVEDKRDMI